MPSNYARSRAEFSRGDKVRKAMLRELSQVLRSELKDPILENQVVSISDIELSTDLSHAKVFVSILGPVELQQAIMAYLQANRGLMRTALSKRVQLRHTPELHIALDDSLERGIQMNALLDTLLPPNREA